ncbi:MAG: aspartate aminotransferase family protein [Gemmatimonadota bacterium]
MNASPVTGHRSPVTGESLPHLVTPIPGPVSQELAQRLSRVESRNITSLLPDAPLFWAEARGANVRDVDGNTFIDLTSGFGVATAGHANVAVVNAIQRQSELLPHALGDVHPADVKVRLLERLTEIVPQPLRVGMLASSGAEAVEAALKTAVMRTGKTGVLAFRNSYHGLTYGALAVTHRSHFREPFQRQLFGGVQFAPFPAPNESCDDALREIDALLDAHDIGAIIVEPIQGRGGIVVPHDQFLAALRARCDGVSRVLIFDEVYTGCGRTGRWLACEHWDVLPDIVVLGKGLSGALPISVCIGSDAVMRAWPVSTGEAIHTSTFLGNPIACAAAIAQLDEIETHGLLERARKLGELIREQLAALRVVPRGIGLIQGVALARADGGPDTERALAVCRACLRQGVLVLPEGTHSNVLAITPPAVITEPQLSFALSRIGAILSAVSP